MKINVRKIAKLSHLTLHDNEIDHLEKELTSILSYVDKLQELDTDNVPPANQITGLVNVTREDVVASGNTLSQEEALQNAPRKKGDYFEVNAVFEND